jgi:hypothetical protein
MKDLRSGGEAATDQGHDTANNISMQELASAGPSAIESFGPEPGGSIVRVDISSYAAQSCTFRLRCGLVVAGGES